MSQHSEASREKRPNYWSSRSIGSNWQHQIFYLLVRMGGRRAAYLLLYFVIAHYVLFSPLVRKRCGHYIKRRFLKASKPERLWHTYRLLLQFGKVLVDRAVVGILGPQQFHIDMEGEKELLQVRDENTGMILMTAHVSGWQVAMSSLNFLQRPVNMLMRREDGDIDRHYYEHTNQPPPYHIIDPAGYLGGTLEMMGALKQGEVICVMGDRLLGSHRSGIEVEFLGEKAVLPFSAYKLASATGAPIVIFFYLKNGPSSYLLKLAKVIHVPPLRGRQADTFRPFVEEFSGTLEEICQQHPYQFFNFFDMWTKTDR